MERDHIKSSDLKRWLKYVGWTEQQFDESADKFRDPNVWWIRDGLWTKHDIDGEERSYGKCNLSDEEKNKFFIE